MDELYIYDEDKNKYLVIYKDTDEFIRIKEVRDEEILYGREIINYHEIF